MDSWAKALEEMKRLSVSAGEEILRIYQTPFAVEYKLDASPVTQADKAANDIIVEGLKQIFPQIPVLAEESADDKSRLLYRYCFIVDPLDGTREFIQKNGEFTVNIALCEDGVPVAGVIYAPVQRELYGASLGKGAYLITGDGETCLRVSSRTGKVRMAVSRSHKDPELLALAREKGIQHFIEAGSAYKACLIARGDAEIYYRSGRIMEWDTAAMQILVTEAGGIFNGLDGRPFRYNKEDTRNPTGFYILNHPANALLPG